MLHKVELTSPPKNVPVDLSYSYVLDGAISGNGDIGIVWGGTSKKISLYVSKANFWKAKAERASSGLRLIGNINISLKNADENSFSVEQDMDNCILTGTFKLPEGDATIHVTPVATDNIILIDIESPENATLPAVDLAPYGGNESIIDSGKNDDISWITKGFNSEDLLFETHAIITMKSLTPKTENGKIHSRYVFGVLTNHDSPHYKTLAINNTSITDDWKFSWFKKVHKKWWQDFWSKSSVKIADEELELNWYSGLYIMACCGRNKKFPPGIFGNFIVNNNPPWCGDYHLNYNYEAAFYPLFSSNHEELGECYDSPLTDFIHYGRKFSKDYLGCDGIYYPVGLGPIGTEPSVKPGSLEFGHCFLGQKSNASYAATVMTMHWYSTYNESYAINTAYPYLREVAAFWETYLKFEDNRYVIYNDAIHEVDFWRDDFDPKTTPNHIDDFNPILSLGAIRMTLKCLLDMVNTLGIEEEKVEKWEHILSHLSNFPTFEKDGKTVFRYTERGMEWLDNNALGIQHIYPCGEIGLFSDKNEIEIARNSFFAVDRWDDKNAFSSYYPCAARLKVDPDLIIENLKKIYKKRQWPNLLFNIFGGCLENTSTTATTINEMLLQSHKKIVVVFPCWTKKLDVEFNNLRAYGAFLVSSKMTNGNIEFVTIKCQRESTLKILNPYKNTNIVHNGTTFTSSDKIISIETKCGDTIVLTDINK